MLTPEQLAARLARLALHLLVTAACCVSATASAEEAQSNVLPTDTVDLMQVYYSAKENDPVLGQATAGYAAAQQLVPQARSALLPNVSAGANSSWSERSFPLPAFQDADPTSPSFGQFIEIPDQEFNEHGWQAQLSQPILDLPNWFAYTSSKATVNAAEWQLAGTEQALILRVVQAYLDVLRIQDLLDSTVAEETAVHRQLEQVQQRFDVGLVAITDVLESQAVFDNAVVERIQAAGDHDIFFETLRTLTSEPYDSLGALSDMLPIVDPEPQNEEEWVQTALSTNFGIRAAQSQLSAANRTVRARRSGHLPTIDATVSQNHFVSGGQTVFGGAGIKADTTVYGVQLNMPVFTGGFTRARTKEATALADQSREALLEQQLAVARDARNLFRSVATSVVRVGARLKAIKSTQSALDATQTGYEVGTRNIVDVLRAQQLLYRSQFDYADSRYNYVTGLMALKQVSGVLNEEDLIELNTFIDTNDSVNRILDASLRMVPTN